MSRGKGQFTKFGIIDGAAWGTPVALASTALIKITGDLSFAPSQEVIQDESAGMVFPEYVDLGRKNQEISYTGDLRYENQHWMHFAHFIGSDVHTGANPYTHVMDLQDETSLFYTGAGLVDDQVYEWPSIKAVGWEISTGGDGFMQFSATGIADNELIAADATNTATTIGTNASYDTQQLRVPFGHARVNINAQAGADFNASGDGTDRVCPIGITISSGRPYVRDFTACRTTANAREWQTDEPVEDGLKSDICIVTLEFPELTTDDYMEDFQDNNMKKMEILFYDTANRQIKFQFPNLFPLLPDATLPGAGRIGNTVSYQALTAQSAPTGMTGITQPYRLTVINSFALSYVDLSVV